jgi:hypothetical protein
MIWIASPLKNNSFSSTKNVASGRLPAGASLIRRATFSCATIEATCSASVKSLPAPIAICGTELPAFDSTPLPPV